MKLTLWCGLSLIALLFTSIIPAAWPLVDASDAAVADTLIQTITDDNFDQVVTDDSEWLLVLYETNSSILLLFYY